MLQGRAKRFKGSAQDTQTIRDAVCSLTLAERVAAGLGVEGLRAEGLQVEGCMA